MANRRVFSRIFSVRGRHVDTARRRSSVLMSGAGALGTMLSLVIAGSGATAVAVAPVITHAPRVVTGNPHGNVNTWSAANWSGYAEAGSGFTGVSGSWTVPSVTGGSSSTYSSVWIGVDGFNNNSLIQTGTEEDWYNNAPHYNAWWEILPAAETAISSSAYPVSPGDRMSASIWETTQTASSGGHGFRFSSQHVWAIKIGDTTKGWSFLTAQAYGGAGSSAEWIVEAPQVGGRIAPMAHYSFASTLGLINTPGLGTTTGDFDQAGTITKTMSTSTTTPPAYGGAGLVPNDAGVMIQNGAQVSTPSNPDAASPTNPDSTPGKAYNAAYGATAPAGPNG